MQRPINVGIFEVLIYFAFMLDAAEVLLRNKTLLDRAGNWETGTIYLFLFAALVYIVWSAAHRGRNWARWLLVILFFTSAPDYLAILADFDDINYGVLALRAFSDILQLIALVFVFTPSTRPWFRPGTMYPQTPEPHTINVV
ncbi:hypothetical protein KW797_01170 [Candidatus Parcubacteria bacterium]|nr:hypothetical protein [Candidatus Parcubacteria bacterium]